MLQAISMQNGSIQLHSDQSFQHILRDKVYMLAQILFDAMKYFFYDCSTLFLFCARQLVPKTSDTPKNSTPASYSFSQQVNDSCHLTPIYNYHKLLEAKVRAQAENQKDDDLLSSLPSYTRREWLAQNQEHLKDWHQFIFQFNKEEVQQQYPHLFQWLKKAITIGPTMPHIFNEKGKNVFEKRLHGLREFVTVPYFLIDIQQLEKQKVNLGCTGINLEDVFDLEELGLKMPLIKDQGIYKIYDYEQQQFVAIEEIGQIHIQDDGIVQFDYTYFDTHPEDTKRYGIPDKGIIVKMKQIEALGVEEMAIAQNFGVGFQFDGKEYAVYEMSLYKFMLMTLGLDENNHQITEEHPDYLVYQDFKKFAGSSHSLWSTYAFEKEFFLQYQLAEIFKDHPELYQAASALADNMIYPLWGTYQNLLQEGIYYNQFYAKIDQRSQSYLPGKEQALAYFYMRTVRYLTYAACNHETLSHAFELDSIFGYLSQLFPFKILTNIIKLNAYQHHRIKLKTIEGKTHNETISFMELWQILKEKLAEKGEDYVSFDDHGWVCSFDPRLIKKQLQLQSFEDPMLIQDLGLCMIESIYAKTMRPWYQTH